MVGVTLAVALAVTLAVDDLLVHPVVLGHLLLANGGGLYVLLAGVLPGDILVGGVLVVVVVVVAVVQAAESRRRDAQQQKSQKRDAVLSKASPPSR